MKTKTNDSPILAGPEAIDKSGDRVRTMFGSIASRYDLLNHVLSLNIDKRWRNRTIRSVPPKPGDVILDVCTGTGDLALGYAQSGHSGLKVIGVDFCPEMLEVARTKNHTRKTDVIFREADAQQLPFDDDEFSIVSCAFGLRNVTDTRRGLEEMARVARVGGKVAILEFSRPTLPGFRWLYLAYFKHLLPRIGQSVSRNDSGAYEYLPSSVMAFPDGVEMAALLQSVGLVDVQVNPLTLGIATLYIGTKQS